MKVEFLILSILCAIPILIGITGLLGFLYSGMVEDFKNYFKLLTTDMEYVAQDEEMS